MKIARLQMREGREGERGLPVAGDDEFHKYMNKTWSRLSGRLSGHLFAADSLKTKPGQSRAEQS